MAIRQLKKYFPSSAKRHWRDSYWRETMVRFKRVYRLIGPYGRRLFWENQAGQAVRMLFTTLTYAVMAMLLLVFSKADAIDRQPQLSAIKNFLQIENTDNFLIFLCVAFIGLIIVDRLLDFFIALRMHRNNIAMRRLISVTLYTYYLTQNYCYSSTRDPNALINKVQGGAGTVNLALSPLMSGILTTFNIVLIISALLYMHAGITILLAIGLSIYYLIYYRVAKDRLRLYGKEMYELGIGKTKLLRTGITPFMDVMFSGKELEFKKTFDELMQKQAFWEVRQHIVNSIVQPLLRVLSMVFVCLLVIYMLSIDASRDVLPTIAIFITAGLRLLPLVSSLQGILLQAHTKKHEFYELVADLEMAFRMQEQIEELGQLQRLDLNRLVTLKNISYRYPSQQTPALKDINLELPIKRKIAFCGPSGSGKTTLARMICGLLKPDSGQIIVDEHDIWSNLNVRRRWHGAIAMMQQQPFFLNDTVAANVAFSMYSESIDLKRVREVIEVVQLKELVDSLPHGVHTEVGEGATQLSGGQAQRLSVARALYTEVPLLILDETTSALDAITEKRILDNLALLGDQTIIVIAHRLEIMRNLDCIYVMNQGRIVAHGTFDELLESCDLFRQLARQYTEEPQAESQATAPATTQ